MNKKCIIPLLFLVLFLPLLLSPMVHGTTITIEEYSFANGDKNDISTRTQPYPTGAVSNAKAQSFIPDQSGYLTSLVLRLTKTGSPVGYMRGAVWLVTDLNTKPDSFVILDSSTNDVSMASLNAGAIEVTNGSAANDVTFTFDGTYYLNAGTAYAIGYYVVNASMIDGSNCPLIIMDVTPAHEGKCYTQYSSTWNSGEPYDLCFTVYGSDGVAPTASPAPLPTGGSYDTSNVNALINTFMGYLVPLLLWLLPAAFLGWLTHWAKWPIMIGLAIGGGLCYLFLGTQYVWMVFIVTIGLVGMAYQSVRGGGTEQ